MDGMGHGGKVLEWRDILAGFLDNNSEVRLTLHKMAS